MKDINKLRFTIHSRERACQRILGIENPTIEEALKVLGYLKKAVYWSDYHSKFLIESVVDGSMHELVVVDEVSVVTIKNLQCTTRHADYSKINKIPKRNYDV